jgi:hypothetical protein
MSGVRANRIRAHRLDRRPAIQIVAVEKNDTLSTFLRRGYRRLISRATARRTNPCLFQQRAPAYPRLLTTILGASDSTPHRPRFGARLQKSTGQGISALQKLLLRFVLPIPACYNSASRAQLPQSTISLTTMRKHSPPTRTSSLDRSHKNLPTHDIQLVGRPNIRPSPLEAPAHPPPSEQSPSYPQVEALLLNTFTEVLNPPLEYTKERRHRYLLTRSFMVYVC